MKQCNDIFCSAISKSVNGKEVSSDKNFMSENGLMQKVVSKEDQLFHVLGVPNVFSKYVLHQAHDVLGHNVTARTYQCLKYLYLWKHFYTMYVV